MKQKTYAIQLQEKIALQEIVHAENQKLLSEQFLITYTSLQPVNIIKSTISEVFTTPALGSSILGTVVGVISGFISKKIVVGHSHSKIREIAGTLLQFGVTNIITANPKMLSSIVSFISSKFFHSNPTQSTNK